MSKNFDAIGIIPARYDSSRFPGKPLAMILGKPMFARVYEQASKCSGLSKVVLATDDQRIFDAAKERGMDVVMTAKDHKSGTDRVLEAAKIISVSPESIVVNIQGDEPALDPAMLDELLAPFSTSDVQVATLAREITSKEAENPSLVKVVLDNRSRALYFSRSPIPFPRDKAKARYLGHVGLYAFKFKALEIFSRLMPGELEQAEKLEQLRLLENGINIHVSMTTRKSIGVDTPEDVPLAEKIILETTK